jgi:two-component system chemotaxis response regulator CheB
VIAQDEASSVIYGMPREAARAGVVDSVVALNGIARRMIELTA